MKQQRRLVLHFDINKTILMKDKAQKKTTDAMVGGVLAHSLWGKIIADKEGNQRWTLSKLSMENQPYKLASDTLNEKKDDEQNQVTYGQYVESIYPKKTIEQIPNEKKRQKYNQKIIDQRSSLYRMFATKGNPGQKFKGIFDKMMKTLTLPKHVKLQLGVSEQDQIEDLKKLQEQQERQEEGNDDHDDNDQNQADKQVNPSSQEQKEPRAAPPTSDSAQPQQPPAQIDSSKDPAIIEQQKVKQIFRGARFNIIPSFFKTLSYLRKSKRQFAIVFRTFGSDLEDIILEFNRFCEGKHPCFNGKSGNPLVRFDGNKGTKDFRIHNFNRGLFYRSQDINYPSTLVLGTIDRCQRRQLMQDYYSSRVEDGDVIITQNDPAQIMIRLNDTLNQTCAIAIQDDWKTWNKNGQISDAGKPLYIDNSDHSTQHIFFDDNADEDDNCIIDARNIVTGDKIPYHKTINKYIVKVDPLRAILQSDYFIKTIQECENKRDYEIENDGMLSQLENQEQKAPDMFEEYTKLQTLSTDQYLMKTVLPVIYQGMKLTTIQRPKNPLRFLAFYLLKHQDLIKLPTPPPQ